MNRAALKSNARLYLSRKYGDALGVAVVTSLVAGALSILFSIVGNRFNPLTQLVLWDELAPLTGGAMDVERMTEQMLKSIESVLSQLWLVGLILGVSLIVLPLYRILVGNVMTVGRDRWYLRAAYVEHTPPFGSLFSVFRKGDYTKITGAMLWRSFWLFLWSIPPYLILFLGLLPQQIVFYHLLINRAALTEGLILRISKHYGLPLFLFSPLMLLAVFALFLVFMIIRIRKSYQYRMLPYILADNPQLGARASLKIAQDMTRGKVGRLFMLDFSFIGWVLLCLLCICLPWVTLHLFAPYYHMTWAEGYRVIRDEAAKQGILRMEDLGYVRVG